MNGGREGRPIGAYELAKAVEDLGAGEILLNCIDCDGTHDFLQSSIELPCALLSLKLKYVCVKLFYRVL